MNPARLLTLTLLLGVALVALIMALAIGSVALTPLEVWSGLWGGPAADIVLELRLPRAGAAFAVGGLLAVAGALMQVLLRNPLADPYVLGISGGAAAAALLALLLGALGRMVNIAALLGALGSVIAVFWLARDDAGWRRERVLLTGVVIASGWSALITGMLALAPDARLQGMVYWLIGDLAGAGSSTWAWAALLLALLLGWPLGRSLNALALGDTAAAGLGVPLARVHWLLYFLASLCAAAAVTTAGSIGFVGLIVPHAVRLMGLTDHRWLLPGSALAGGTLLLAADTLARSVLAPQQLPVGVLTAIIGVPLFLLLLRRGA